MSAEKLSLTDPDGDRLEVNEAFSFDRPMLALWVEERDLPNFVAVNLDVENAARLRDFLAAFVGRHNEG